MNKSKLPNNLDSSLTSNPFHRLPRLRTLTLAVAACLFATPAFSATQASLTDETAFSSAMALDASGEVDFTATPNASIVFSATHDLSGKTVSIDGGGTQINGTDGASLTAGVNGLFTYSDAGTLNLSGINLIGAASGARALVDAEANGGAMVDLSLNIDKSSFQGASTQEFGGAIFARGTVSGEIANSLFEQNHADCSTSGCSGGAIAVTGDFSGNIVGSTFTHNTSSSGGGAIAIQNWDLSGSSQGAYGNFNGSIQDSVFENNSTSDDAGGAIKITGAFTDGISGSTFSSNLSISAGGAIAVVGNFSGGISGSTFEANKAQGNSLGAGGDGGAVMVYGSLDGGITKSSFDQNSANESGGAISVNTDLDDAIAGSSFTGNTAGTYGGAIAVFGDFNASIGDASDGTHTLFDSNSATQYGGAIFVAGSFKGNISNATFTNNSATDSPSDPSSSQIDGYGSGGVIWANEFDANISGSDFENNSSVSSGSVIFSETTFNSAISNSTFKNNVGGATSSGGVIFAIGNITGSISDSKFIGNSANSGAAIGSSRGDLDMKMDNVTFKGNTSTYLGGAISIAQYGNELKNVISNSTFDSNQGASGAIFAGLVSATFDHDAFSNNTAAGAGGAIGTQYGFTGTIKSSTFSKNVAQTGMGGGAIEAGFDFEGTITGTADDMTVFDHNEVDSSSYGGGAILAFRGGFTSNTVVEYTRFSNNSSASVGGAITSGAFAPFGSPDDPRKPKTEDFGGTWSHDIFENNSASGYGGAIAVFVGDSTANFDNSSFTDNASGSYGGAIYVSIGDFTGAITQSKFIENKASDASNGLGAGLFVYGALTGDISNTLFDGNAAGVSGGAIWAGNAASAISGSTFQNNAAELYGGAILSNSDFSGSISNSSFLNNSATTMFGGAIFAAGAFTADIGQTEFNGNQATDASNGNGGAIWAVSIANTISGSTFQSNAAGLYGGAILSNSTLESAISDTTFEGNTAGSFGGAIYSQDVFSGSISNTAFSDNIATAGYGGAIFANSDFSAPISSGSSFTGNQAISGGGIYVYGNLTGGIDSTTFSNNQATAGSGSALYVNGDLTGNITNSTFDGNTATGGQGAIYVGGTMNSDLSGTSFTNNASTGGTPGGAIVLANTATLTALNGDALFSGNTQADSSANAIYIGNAANQGDCFSLGAGDSDEMEFDDPIASNSANPNLAIALNANDDETGTIRFTGGQSAVYFNAGATLSHGAMALENGAVFGANDNAGAFTLGADAALDVAPGARATPVGIDAQGGLTLSGALNFTMPDGVSNDDTMMKTTGAVALDSPVVTLAFAANANLEDGDHVNLIDAGANAVSGDVAAASKKVEAKIGSFLTYDFTVEKSDDSHRLIALLDKKDDSTPQPCAGDSCSGGGSGGGSSGGGSSGGGSSGGGSSGGGSSGGGSSGGGASGNQGGGGSGGDTPQPQPQPQPQPKPQPQPQPAPTHVDNGIQALADGYLAGIASLTSGAELISESGVERMLNAAQNDQNWHAFGIAGGGRDKVDDGRLRLNGGRLMAGVARRASLRSATATFGVFGEYGKNNSETEGHIAKGSGSAKYAGAGLLGRLDFAGGATGHPYLEVMARGGSVSTDFSNDHASAGYAQKSGFDNVSSHYAGAMLGGGYVWKAGAKHLVNLYGKYFWTRQGDASRDMIAAGEHIHFDAVSSSLFRLGGRYTYSINDNAHLYAGLAYEYENGGKVEATAHSDMLDYSLKLDSRDLQGSTGVMEAGFTWTKVGGKPLTLQIGAVGTVGERKGAGGVFRVNWAF